MMNRSISGFRYREAFALLTSNGETELRGAEWADWDSAGRLVFTRSGCLYAANLDALPELREVELVNLNALKPEPVASPDWAKHW